MHRSLGATLASFALSILAGGVLAGIAHAASIPNVHAQNGRTAAEVSPWLSAPGRERRVTVFGSRANGDARPKRVIAGSATGIFEPDGLSVGADGVYVTAAYSGYVGRFGPRANGDAVSRSTLFVDWSNGGQQVLGGIIVAPDSTLYVRGFSIPLIAQYSARAKRHQSPLAVIEGPDTQLTQPTFVYVR